MIVRVRPEETSVVTLQSSFQISNSSIDEFARLCDDALRGGIREQKHEKQKDDEQTRLTSRTPVMHCGVTCPDLPLQKQFISIAQLIFDSGNSVFACVVGVAKEWPHRTRRVSSELLIVLETLLGHCFLRDVRYCS